jgi:hypothetical protein
MVMFTCKGERVEMRRIGGGRCSEASNEEDVHRDAAALAASPEL